MLQFKLVAVLMLASMVHFLSADIPPWYNGCVNTDECAATECCLLGGAPYSIAMCHALLEEGNTCRPNNLPLDITVHYPSGDIVDLTNVYRNVCDCGAGLTCIDGYCVRN